MKLQQERMKHLYIIVYLWKKPTNIEPFWKRDQKKRGIPGWYILIRQEKKKGMRGNA